MDEEFEKSWQAVREKVRQRFGEEVDLQALLFLIGIQELGHGYRKLSKDQKVDVLHIAICKLLEPYGFYEYEGRDKDDWPHWTATQKLPHLSTLEQNRLIRKAIIDYMNQGS